jgi:hypothetical protein
MRNWVVPITVWLSIGAAHAQPPDVPISPYVRLLIDYAGSAATAVACHDRSNLWGVSVHTKIVAIVSDHAGSPIQDSHTPSAAERNAALAALVKSEESGTKQGARPVACRVIRSLYLDELDQFEAGAKSFWPMSLVPHEPHGERPAMI